MGGMHACMVCAPPLCPCNTRSNRSTTPPCELLAPWQGVRSTQNPCLQSSWATKVWDVGQATKPWLTHPVKHGHHDQKQTSLAAGTAALLLAAIEGSQACRQANGHANTRSARAVNSAALLTPVRPALPVAGPWGV